MAKSRKKKKIQQPPSIAKQLEVTKTYFDKYSEVARKVLQILELDPGLFDRFSKKQKLKMMAFKADPPKIKAKEGNSIPRHYLRRIHQEIYSLIKVYPVDCNPEIKLTYMDFLTCGVSFMFYALMQDDSDNQVSNKETYEQIARKVLPLMDKQDGNIMMSAWQYLRYVITSMSKLNIRIYGFSWEWINHDCSFRVGSTIFVSATVPKKIYFNYNDMVRPAYQAMSGEFLTSEAHAITIPYNEVIDGSEQSHSLEVYVQSHALTRIKERIDVLSASLRIFCLTHSLRNCKGVTLINGQRVIELRDASVGVIGYLPFTICGNKLFILTFLPICSQNAPEGKKLQELLGIDRNDIEYLGIDKLSFFVEIDFEAIPYLKSAVINAGLWHLTKIVPLPDYKPQNRISTATLARFFQTERTREEVFMEIAEMY